MDLRHLPQRQLGSSGIEVSAIGLGCMSLSGVYGASDDAASVNGQVFRVGGSSVWPMKGWHSATRIKNPEGRWDPAKLGKRVKEELAKGITAPEGMGEIFAGGL